MNQIATTKRAAIRVHEGTAVDLCVRHHNHVAPHLMTCVLAIGEMFLERPIILARLAEMTSDEESNLRPTTR